MIDNQIYLNAFAHNLVIYAKQSKDGTNGFMQNIEWRYVFGFGKHGYVQTALANSYAAGELPLDKCLSCFAEYLNCKS
jgi:hypothetical protein